jgi:hypothetical protein
LEDGYFNILLESGWQIFYFKLSQDENPSTRVKAIASSNFIEKPQSETGAKLGHLFYVNKSVDTNVVRLFHIATQ